MPKRSGALDSMPAVVLTHLRELGDNLAIGRIVSQSSLSKRLPLAGFD
jgi:hypothetical protein